MSTKQSISADAQSAVPAVVATFVVKFDERKGYILPWQRSIDGLDIDGVVDFKSMPSGLHNVKEDLVYFVYEDYAGVSAVLNVEDEQAARKARIFAVGVLVPLEHGKMGKSWLHAEGLRKLAREQAEKEDDYSSLEKYWDEHKIASSPPAEENDEITKMPDLSIDTNNTINSTGYQTTRAMSTGAMLLASDHVLPAHHPGLVLPELLRLLGPLIFPLVRAALLRKRILFLGEAPVERTCNYVYNLSILSSLPKPIATILPNLDPGRVRLRPLFNIGVSDIPLLENESIKTNGWIACTTDDVICTKPDLFDVLVILPSATSQHASLRGYPKMYFSSPELSNARPKHGLKASQRDAKRFATLSKGLQAIPRTEQQSKDPLNTSAIADSPETSPDSTSGAADIETASVFSSASSTISLRSVVEPQSWSRIAYTSIVWWASAGDKRVGLSEMEENENEQDVALLTGENLEGDDDNDDESRTREVACVQYFHRLTNLMFTAMSDAVQRNDGYEQTYTDDETIPQDAEQDNQDTEEDTNALLSDQSQQDKVDDSPMEITQDDMQSMGLDVWSTSDKQFLEDFVKLWWNRKATIQGGRIECCGVRIL